MKSKIWIAAVVLMVCAANLYAQSGPFVKHLMHYDYYSRGIDKYILSVGLDREMKMDGQCLIYDRKDTSEVGRLNFQHGQLVDKLLINTPELKFTAFFVYPIDTSYKLVDIEELNKSAVPQGEFVREKFYKEKRVLYEKYTYANGKRNGSCEKYELHSWDTPGEGTWQRYTMTNDVFDGMYLRMWDNGDTVQYGRYDKGKKEGCWFEFRAYVGYRDSVWFKEGVRNGVSKVWNTEGQLISDEYYLNGNKNGLSRTWHSNGTLASERHYKEGLSQGTTKLWSDKGVLLQVSRYDTLGQRDGFRESWYENGRLSERVHFHADELDGKSEYFYETGKLRRLEYYSRNRYDGIVKEWNEKGELILHQIFKNGELVKTYVNRILEENYGEIEDKIGYLSDDYALPLFCRNYSNLEADKSLIFFSQKSEAVVDFLNLWYSDLSRQKKKQCQPIRQMELTFQVESKSIKLIEVKGASVKLNQEMKDFILSRYENVAYGNMPATIKVIVPFDHSFGKR